jgi:pectin methylesterase-like acyl-CoA thioesterase
MSGQSQTPTSGQATIDRYESTFVVSQDVSKGDFTSVQPAVDALPAAGGKIFVKAGVYPLSNSIRVTKSNIQIQGEGMGITNFVADSTMTGNTPGLEAFSSASDGTPSSAIRREATPQSRLILRMRLRSRSASMCCCTQTKR